MLPPSISLYKILLLILQNNYITLLYFYFYFGLFYKSHFIGAISLEVLFKDGDLNKI